jgi:voltage-gated potassium channel
MPRLPRPRVWAAVDPGAHRRSGRRLTAVVAVVATLNVLSVVVGSVDAVYDRGPWLFDTFAVLSVLLFTVLYAVRLWAVTAGTARGAVDDRLRLARTPILLVDLVVIVVFWAGVLTGVEARGAVRILWLAHVFNLPHLRRSRRRFRRVFAAQREDLAIAFTGAGMLVLVSSTLMYYVERSAQPEAFASIPDALWWGVVTLTTVGYGDVVPVTPLGRVLGAITTFGGIAFFALPSSVLAAGFIADRTTDQSETLNGGGETGTSAGGVDPTTATGTCPKCGKRLGVEHDVDRY